MRLIILPTPAQYDLILREPAFTAEIHEVIDCIHGKKDIPFRPGKSYGTYKTDLSRWTAGYIIGREISPIEVSVTNSANHPGHFIRWRSIQHLLQPSPPMYLLHRCLMRLQCLRMSTRNHSRPVSLSSWPTLDPLTHPTEIYTDEDKESIDISAINAGQIRGQDCLLLITHIHIIPIS